MIAGAGAKLVHAKPDRAESPARFRQGSQSNPLLRRRAPRLLKPAARPQHGDLAPFSPSSRQSINSRPIDQSPPSLQLHQPHQPQKPNPTQIYQNDWRQVWRKGLWHQVQRAIVSPPHPSERSHLAHHHRAVSGFEMTRLALQTSIGAY